MDAVALGIKSHIGWAAVVALAGPPASPTVVARRRIDVARTFDEGAVYHRSQQLPLDAADALIRSSTGRFERLALEGLRDLVSSLRAGGREIVAARVLSGGGKALPPLASIVRSHALVHAAEGELYRQLFRRACEACGIAVAAIGTRDLEKRAASALETVPAQLAARLAALGKASGRPWAKDQKECALAAWIVLAG